MAKSKSQEQKEYNDLLGVTQSLLGKILKSSDDLAKSSDKRNRQLEKDANQLESIVGSMQDAKSAQDALNKLQQQEYTIRKRNYGVNEQQKASLLAQNIAAQNAITRNQKANQIMSAVGAQMGDIYTKVSEAVDDISSKLEKIPIVGKGLATFFKPMFEAFKMGVANATTQFGTLFNLNFLANLNDSQSMVQSFTGALSTAGKSISSNLTGPAKATLKTFAVLIGSIYLLKKIFDLGFASFKRIDSAGKAFRETTGLLNSQTESLNQKLVTTETQFANIGASAELIAETAGVFTNTFDGLVQPSQEVLSSLVAINKSFGVGLEDATNTVKVFRNLGDLTEEQATSLTLSVGQAAKLANIAPRQVFEDIANSSSDIQKYFGNNVQLIGATAIEARKLGTSIGNVVKLSQTLLDYNNSINSELEASAILGTSLNFSQARAAAAANDSVGAFKAVGDQLSKIGDLTRLNVYEREALANATGMEFQELLNQQRIRERFSSLNENELRAAQEYLRINGDLDGLNRSQLQAQAEQIANQDEFNSKIESLQNKFNAVKISLQNAFLPVIETFLPAISFVANLFSKLESSAKILSSLMLVLAGIMGTLAARSAAIALTEMVTAVAKIFAGNASLGPIGIGTAIAGVAALTAAVAGARAMIGDGEFSGGNMRISSQEGGLNLIPSKNDDVVVAPGLTDYLASQREGGGGTVVVGLQPLIQKMDELVNATKARTVLVADGQAIASSTSYNDEISLRNNFGMNQTKFSRR